MYILFFTEGSTESLSSLKNDKSNKAAYGAVIKTLKYLQVKPRHPGLNSKPYKVLKGPNNEKIWESYAQQNRPAAYRVFWFYGPSRMQITITSIIPHP